MSTWMSRQLVGSQCHYFHGRSNLSYFALAFYILYSLSVLQIITCWRCFEWHVDRLHTNMWLFDKLTTRSKCTCELWVWCKAVLYYSSVPWNQRDLIVITSYIEFCSYMYRHFDFYTHTCADSYPTLWTLIQLAWSAFQSSRLVLDLDRVWHSGDVCKVQQLKNILIHGTIMSTDSSAYTCTCVFSWTKIPHFTLVTLQEPVTVSVNL